MGFRTEQEGGATSADAPVLCCSLSTCWRSAGPRTGGPGWGRDWWESKPGFSLGATVQQNQRRAGRGDAGGIVASWGAGSQG